MNFFEKRAMSYSICTYMNTNTYYIALIYKVFCIVPGVRISFLNGILFYFMYPHMIYSSYIYIYTGCNRNTGTKLNHAYKN